MVFTMAHVLCSVRGRSGQVRSGQVRWDSYASRPVLEREILFYKRMMIINDNLIRYEATLPPCALAYATDPGVQHATLG